MLSVYKMKKKNLCIREPTQFKSYLRSTVLDQNEEVNQERGRYGMRGHKSKAKGCPRMTVTGNPRITTVQPVEGAANSDRSSQNAVRRIPSRR